METKRICVWCCPRSLSTALMYSFAQRKDTLVFDEPLFAHYIVKSGITHQPAIEESLKTMENDGEKVVQELILGAHNAPIAYFKNMTHYLIDLDKSFLECTKNVLLIRDPVEIINSYLKIASKPTMDFIGVKKQYEFYLELEAKGLLCAVVETKNLLLNPEKILRKLCKKLEIPFYPAMLSWKAGPRKEDGVWAKYWYPSLHESTRFKPYTEKKIKLPDDLIPLAEECKPYYEYLYDKALKV